MRAIHNGHFPSEPSQTTGGQEGLQSLSAKIANIARHISGTGLVVESDDGKLPAPQVDVAMLRRILRARRVRADFFGSGLFADPAWDMLLDLFVSHLTDIRVSVTGLCDASNVPSTTALRWIRTLEDDGLAVRLPDKLDGRRSFIELTKKGAETMERYFSHIGPNFVV